MQLNLMRPEAESLVVQVVPLSAYQRGFPKTEGEIVVLGDHCDEAETRIVRVYEKAA